MKYIFFVLIKVVFSININRDSFFKKETDNVYTKVSFSREQEHEKLLFLKLNKHVFMEDNSNGFARVVSNNLLINTKNSSIKKNILDKYNLTSHVYVEDVLVCHTEDTETILNIIDELKDNKYVTDIDLEDNIETELYYINDPFYSLQQNYINVIEHPYSIQDYSLSGLGTNIFITDNGIDVNHSDINTTKLTILDNTADTGHGTHVMGIISAILNNSYGIAGLSDDVSITFSNFQNPFQNLLNDFSNIEGPVLMQNSWGPIKFYVHSNLFFQMYETMLNYDDPKGRLLVFAAGNSGEHFSVSHNFYLSFITQFL